MPMTADELDDFYEGAEPSFGVDISGQDPRWESQNFDPVELVEMVVRETLFSATFGQPIEEEIKGGELGILLTNDVFVKTLNREYRGKDKPTNVLSFPTDQRGPGMPIGDVIIAFETVEKESIDQMKPLRDHMMHLVVHGTLHLLGYTHDEDSEAQDMENLEIWILQKFGVSNPYITGPPIKD